MIPQQLLIDRIAALIADDTDWLGAATANHMHLVIDAFTPTPALVTTDLVLGDAAFAGSAALNIGTGVQVVIRDSATGALGVILKEPTGGLRWVCTSAPADPVTVYGFALTDNADDFLMGTALLPTPAVIQFVGDYVQIGAEFGFLAVIPIQ